jgi:LSD1 subclass zinc finger protein
VSVPAVGAQAIKANQFPCAQCGAKLEYAPGTDSLKCPYCQHENPIPQRHQIVEELDYLDMLEKLKANALEYEPMTVKCRSCAAEVNKPGNVDAFACPFCGSNIVATAQSHKQIKPNAVLPFKITRQQADGAFRQWLGSRWFAPNALKTQGKLDASINGLYLPYWTYDCRTITRYTGERGDYYYVPVTRTVIVNGKATTQTVMEQRVRWTPCSGVVEDAFDDVLIIASHSLQEDKLRKLEPWDLPSVKPYADEYLSGFVSESYQVDLPTGFEHAKVIMRPTIEHSIMADIGGDVQRIGSMNVQYRDITYKHVLMPVWISAYRYMNKVYQFVVNARTGEVTGDRPYSFWKITFLVIAILIALAIVIAIVAASR